MEKLNLVSIKTYLNPAIGAMEISHGLNCFLEVASWIILDTSPRHIAALLANGICFKSFRLFSLHKHDRLVLHKYYSSFLIIEKCKVSNVNIL